VLGIKKLRRGGNNIPMLDYARRVKDQFKVGGSEGNTALSSRCSLREKGGPKKKKVIKRGGHAGRLGSILKKSSPTALQPNKCWSGRVTKKINEEQYLERDWGNTLKEKVEGEETLRW